MTTMSATPMDTSDTTDPPIMTTMYATPMNTDATMATPMQQQARTTPSPMHHATSVAASSGTVAGNIPVTWTGKYGIKWYGTTVYEEKPDRYWWRSYPFPSGEGPFGLKRAPCPETPDSKYYYWYYIHPPDGSRGSGSSGGTANKRSRSRSRSAASENKAMQV